MPKKTGIVKMYNAEKGYGFIKPDDGSEDVHFHSSKVNGRSPTHGDVVEFDSIHGPKGPTARYVNVISSGVHSTAKVDKNAVGDASLPEKCIFDTFYNRDNGALKDQIFYDTAKELAQIFEQKGLTASGFYQIYLGLRSFITLLQSNRINMDVARERFGKFYVNLARQNKRGHVPNVVLKWFDEHQSLALSSRKEMLGLYQFIYNVHCYF